MHGTGWLANETMVAVAIFFCLAGASLGSLFVYGRLPARHRDEETAAVVRLVANIFVVMSSLVLGLMINSAKNTYESIDRNVHSYATEIILLDRLLRDYGPETNDARQRMTAYVAKLVAPNANQSEPGPVANRSSETTLRDIRTSLQDMTPPDVNRQRVQADAIRQMEEVFRLRWILIEQSEGTIPAPLIAMLVAWLMLILASFGYRAPKNVVIVSSFIIASALLAGAIYLILDMDVPFAGPIQISDQPLRRALAELQLP